jgi:transcriptional regulator with XRE-family HTH domain
MEWDKDAVRKLRQTLDLTQMEFADLLGCRQQTISEWEQGLYSPANAYGKLLTQLKIQSPRSFLLTPVVEEQEDTSYDELKSDQEFRPFDPAVD